MTMRETDLDAELLALGRIIGPDHPMGWLRDRWRHLDQVSPQVDLVPAAHRRSVGSRGLAWVAADLVVQVDGECWGEVSTRPGTYLAIMNALVAADEDSIKDWVHQIGHPRLLEMPGPHGPVYQAGDDGQHRIAILKALGIQWQCEIVPQRGLEVGENLLDFVNARIPAHLPQERRRYEQAVHEQLQHLELLTRAGLVEPVGRTYSLENRSYVVTSPLPFPWALSQPKDVAAASLRYRQSYHRFGSTEAQRASLDADTWSQYLTALLAQRQQIGNTIQTPLAQP